MANSTGHDLFVNSSGSTARPLGVNVNFVSTQASSARRTAWWWQAGPVDSCCCCFSLPTGIILLAVSEMLSGLICLSMEHYYPPLMRDAYDIAATQYNQTCSSDVIAQGADCQKLEDAMKLAMDIIAFVESHSVLYVLAGIAHVVFAASGFLAVCGNSVFGAKMFMFTWPLSFIYQMAVPTPKPSSAASVVLSAFLALYFVKVSWSFYTRLGSFERRMADDEAEILAGVQAV